MLDGMSKEQRAKGREQEQEKNSMPYALSSMLPSSHSATRDPVYGSTQQNRSQLQTMPSNEVKGRSLLQTQSTARKLESQEAREPEGQKAGFSPRTRGFVRLSGSPGWGKSPIPLEEGHAPSIREDSILDAGIRMIVSLLLVLALIVAGVFLLRKMTPYKRLMSNAKHPMSVLSRISLGQKKSICLVKVAGEILVIGLTNTNMSILSKINADDLYGENPPYSWKNDESGKDIYQAEAYAVAGHKRSFTSLLGILRTKLRRQDNEF